MVISQSVLDFVRVDEESDIQRKGEKMKVDIFYAPTLSSTQLDNLSTIANGK